MTGKREEPSTRTERAPDDDAAPTTSGTRTTDEPQRWSVHVPARPEPGTGDAPPARIPPTEPPAAPPAAGAPPPDEPSVPSRTVFLLVAIAGGILFLGFLVSTVLGGDHPLSGLLVFAGATMLVIVLFVGAVASTDLPTEARVTMGVLAGLLVLLAAWGLLWVTQTPYATTCGAIAAVPGLFALRFFTALRDGFLFAGAAEAPPADPAA